MYTEHRTARAFARASSSLFTGCEVLTLAVCLHHHLTTPCSSLSYVAIFCKRVTKIQSRANHLRRPKIHLVLVFFFCFSPATDSDLYLISLLQILLRCLHSSPASSRNTFFLVLFLAFPLPFGTGLTRKSSACEEDAACEGAVSDQESAAPDEKRW